MEAAGATTPIHRTGPKGGVQAGHQRAQRLVPGRDDPPEAGPGQPGAEQLGAAAGYLEASPPQSSWIHLPDSGTQGR